MNIRVFFRLLNSECPSISSWRSRPGLVSLVNQLFVPAFSHLLEPEQVRLQPQPEKVTHIDTEELFWWNAVGSKNAIRHREIAIQLYNHKASGITIRDKESGGTRIADWQDIAILCRSHARIQELAEACVAQGIPVSTELAGLMNSPEVLASLACLRWLYDSNDTLAAAEITTLFTGEGPEYWLSERIQTVQNQTGRGWDDEYHVVTKRLADARDQFTCVLSPTEALNIALQIGGVHQLVVSWTETKRLTDHRLANLQRLRELAAEYEDYCGGQNPAATVTGFLIWLKSLEQYNQDKQSKNPGNAVHIGTYHSAKGLEWPIVLVTDLDNYPKPSLFGIRTHVDPHPFDWKNPLAGRSLRYLLTRLVQPLPITRYRKSCRTLTNGQWRNNVSGMNKYNYYT